MKLTVVHPLTKRPLHESDGEVKAFRLFIPYMFIRDEEKKKWAFNIGLHLAMVTSDLKHGCYVPFFSVGNVTGGLRVTFCVFEHTLVVWPLGEE